MKNETSPHAKSLKIACCATLLVMLCMTFSACLCPNDNCTYIKVDGFKICCTHYENSSDYYSIDELTDFGKQQEELVIPQKFNGNPVRSIGSIFGPCFHSPNLKKLFWGGNQYLNNKRIVGSCPSLDTVVFTSNNLDDYREFFSSTYINAFDSGRRTKIILADCVKYMLQVDPIWGSNSYYYDDYIIKSPTANVLYYYNYPNTDTADSHINYVAHVLYNKMLAGEDLFSEKELDDEEYDLATLNRYEYIDYLYMYFTKYRNDEEVLDILTTIRLGGYAWIDYLEPGDKIMTLPPVPERKGYEFTGWYVDSQCTTSADFESIVKADDDIKLYAGWKQI